MEKKLILVGISTKSGAFNFMNMVIRVLSGRSVHIAHIDLCRLRFETPNAKVWFVYEQWAKYWLEGIRADAIFGEHWPELVSRAKPDAVIAWRDHIGLVDYICKVEAEALIEQKAIEQITDALYTQLGIKRIMTDNSATEQELAAWRKHTYEPIKDALRPYPVNGYVDTDCKKRIADMGIDDMWPKSIYISTARHNGRTAFENAVKRYLAECNVPYIEIRKGENNMPIGVAEYIRNDVENVAKLHATMQEINDRNKRRSKLPGIKNVHFSGPVTAVIWEDGTKTIVRCQGDNVQDPEKGLAMAIAKKAFGTNKSGSNYYDIFKQWLPKAEVAEEEKQDG